MSKIPDSEDSTRKDLEEWSHQDVLHWLVSQDMGTVVTSVHNLNWSGMELIEIGSCVNEESSGHITLPDILNDLNSVDESTKKTLLKRVVRLVAQFNSEQTSELHGWDFEKDWNEWRTILEEWQFSEIVNVERRYLQWLDHKYSVAVLLVSTVATTWTAATFGRENKDNYFYPAVTLFLSCLLTTLTGYMKLSGLKVQLESAYATHEHQNHLTDFMFKQLSLRPEARHHYQEYKQEIHALYENRNEHSAVLDITTSERMKIVKHIRKHEDEIYRQLWAPYPGFHQKNPRSFSDPLKDAHDHDVNKGAYFEWHRDPDHDSHGYYGKSLAALNHLSGGLLLRYWPLHRPENKASAANLQRMATRDIIAFGKGTTLDIVASGKGSSGLPTPDTASEGAAVSRKVASDSRSERGYKREEKRWSPEDGSK